MAKAKSGQNTVQQVEALGDAGSLKKWALFCGTFVLKKKDRTGICGYFIDPAEWFSGHEHL